MLAVPMLTNHNNVVWPVVRSSRGIQEEFIVYHVFLLEKIIFACKPQIFKIIKKPQALFICT